MSATAERFMWQFSGALRQKWWRTEESLQRVKSWDNSNSLSCQNKDMRRPLAWEDASNSLIGPDGRHGSFIPPDGYIVLRKVTALYPHCGNNLMTWRGWKGSSLAACIVRRCAFMKQKLGNYEISDPTCAIYWEASQKTPIEKRLNGLAWGCVRNHMEAVRMSSFHTCFFWHQ